MGQKHSVHRPSKFELKMIVKRQKFLRKHGPKKIAHEKQVDMEIEAIMTHLEIVLLWPEESRIQRQRRVCVLYICSCYFPLV